MPAESASSVAPEAVPTQAGYDRWAAIYDTDENPLVALEEPVMRGLIGDVAGRRVLDIGCGTGRHTAALAAGGAQVIAIDFSQGMLEQAQRKPGCRDVEFIVHDLADPFPFRDGGFDVIVCGLVIDHIRALEALFKEMRRVCRADGFAAVSVMHPAMSLIGVQARFTDPTTGGKVLCGSEENTSSDYIMAITSAGWKIERMIERSVDAELIQKLPKAAKYSGWPMLMAWRLIH